MSRMPTDDDHFTNVEKPVPGFICSLMSIGRCSYRAWPCRRHVNPQKLIRSGGTIAKAELRTAASRAVKPAANPPCGASNGPNRPEAPEAPPPTPAAGPASCDAGPGGSRPRAPRGPSRLNMYSPISGGIRTEFSPRKIAIRHLVALSRAAVSPMEKPCQIAGSNFQVKPPSTCFKRMPRHPIDEIEVFAGLGRHQPEAGERGGQGWIDIVRLDRAFAAVRRGGRAD